MEEKKVRRRFDKQFKLDAVRLMGEGGRTIAQLSRDLGISVSQLRRWREKFGPDSAKGKEVPGDNAELKKLQRELARVTEEREILKKALAVFSRRPG
jgi:transposase